MDAAASCSDDRSRLSVAQVILRPRKARPFFGRHPWVLDSAIDHVEGSPADGDVVDLVSDKGKFVARGIYNGRSRIRVRLYSWSAVELLDDDFWLRRIRAAVQLRDTLGYNDPEQAARLVYSEADGLSGLIVDRYADYLVVQVTALAVETRLARLLPLLAEVARPRGIVVRGERAMAKLEGLTERQYEGWGEAPPGPIVIAEHGIRYSVELARARRPVSISISARTARPPPVISAIDACSTCSATPVGSAWPHRRWEGRPRSWRSIPARR